MMLERALNYFIAIVLLISFNSYSSDIENYVGLSGKFTDDGSAVLSVAEKTIIPEGWLAFFEDDSLRMLPIEWRRGENWQNHLAVIGQKNYIAIIIDGSNRRVYFAKPSGMFGAGSYVLNPNSLVYAQNNVLKDIIRRSEVNLSRYEQQEIARRAEEVIAERQRLEAVLSELDNERANLTSQMATAQVNAQVVPMRNDQNVFPLSNDGVLSNQQAFSDQPSMPPGLPSHSTPGSEETLYNSLSRPSKMPTVTATPFGGEGGDVEVVSQPTTVGAGLYADSQETYSFKIQQGLVIADNLKRLSDFIGYTIHLRNVPSTCDFESYANETLSGRNKLAMFREYANRYFFSVDPQPSTDGNSENIVVLTYNGDAHVFEGCMK